MRFKFAISVICLFVFSCGWSVAGNNNQNIWEKISIDDISMTQEDSLIDLSFRLSTGEKLSGRRQMLTLRPVIMDSAYRVEMSKIVVDGKKSALIRSRSQWAENSDNSSSFYISEGDEFNYSARVEAQRWMTNAKVVVEAWSEGCCQTVVHETRDIGLVDIDVLPDVDISYPQYTVAEPIDSAFIPISMGDTLSISFSFIVPDSEFDPEQPYVIYDDERDSSLVVLYHQGSTRLDQDFMNNAREMVNLISTINLILDSGSSNVKRVVVAGFSSPEGNFIHNDRLAWGRAVAVKEYIIDNTSVDPNDIILYNGSADWRGLRLYVNKSEDIPYKDEVLSVIENVNIWDQNSLNSKLNMLKKIGRGESYKYIYEEIFPKLRSGAFIKVYYVNN